MELVVAGVSNKNIATELDISSRTVKIHRSRIMKRLRARSLADLVQASLQLQSRSPAAMTVNAFRSAGDLACATPSPFVPM